MFLNNKEAYAHLKCFFKIPMYLLLDDRSFPSIRYHAKYINCYVLQSYWKSHSLYGFLCFTRNDCNLILIIIGLNPFFFFSCLRLHYTRFPGVVACL